MCKCGFRIAKYGLSALLAVQNVCVGLGFPEGTGVGTKRCCYTAFQQKHCVLDGADFCEGRNDERSFRLSDMLCCILEDSHVNKGLKRTFLGWGGFLKGNTPLITNTVQDREQ
ncbi:hypothetical protein FA15DRAFT_329759 [Coprinopsis marcescibilis]|uniref:Extracellular membrane protein CFEM domain-containing protein n=1 Tax=Coprinopsis marcescibilis TaxID=230819 RepID=A0A5C3KZF4_COPMA|nr:hypothetical protein FA15DRAFT_329759 [Coprinopsis marcescibilis]